MNFLIILLCAIRIHCYKLSENEKHDLCKSLNCKNVTDHVCGIREEGSGFWLRPFKNECELLSHGCTAEKGKEYGLISKFYCEGLQLEMEDNKKEHSFNATCEDIVCDNKTDPICAVRNDEQGYRVRRFENECLLNEYNCVNGLDFVKIDIDCDDIELDNKLVNVSNKFNFKNIVVVNGSMLNFHGNLNDTIDQFFFNTHTEGLRLREISMGEKVLNDTRRGRLIKIAGPVKIFAPWTNIPKIKFNDSEHEPTLRTCYHRCPEACPDTYAPVCGVPGILAREPSLMFQNHCFMDKAQCKMYHENKSPTARSSAYIESAFMFCMGDELNALYRFLPTIRTLQKMGRLQRKGKFKYKLRNLRFFNLLLKQEPKLMG